MNQQQQVRQGAASCFPQGFSLPALELPSKNYSLEADIATGWQPKMRVVGPVPLNFDSAVVDEVVERLTMFGWRGKERVIYLGWRYASSFKLHQEIKRQYLYKYQSLINNNYPHLAAYFRKFYNHFKPKHTPPFHGNNPTLQQPEPIFDSNFESGNLDAAIKVASAQYDLFMRVDSNTRGHVQWYNFTVRPNSIKKIKINIVNFRKYRTLYSQSLRPYLYSHANPKNGWKQGCSNVKYDQKLLRYQFLTDIFSVQSITFSCLTFQYEFQGDQLVQFAYCPPFTYSDNLRMIASLHTYNHSPQSKIFKQQILGESLGGLQLQLLTITDPETTNQSKKCVLICGRIHPGQTCGSYMVKGLLQFLCSQEQQAKYLRKHVVFKIIPMINPDGVVIGNFRTSLSGRDLNRMFTSQESLLIPQVKTIKSLVSTLKQEFKSRLSFFLDFHGHSVRKNVFIYGPEYQIWETNYYRTRILPKIIAGKTEIFRYYSCLFRISDWKRTTARAVFLKQIPHCYTVQASIGSYYSPMEKSDIPFTPLRWEFIGKTIMQSMVQFFQMLQDDRKKEQKKDQKNKKLPQIKQKISNKQEEHNRSSSQAQGSRLSNFQEIQKELFTSKSQGQNFLNQKAHAYLEQIRQQQKTTKKEEQYSEGGSDSEAASDDLGEKQINNLHQQIIISLKEFKEKFYNRNKEETPFRSRNFLRSSQQIPKKGLEMIASLRKKAENIATTKIQLETSNNTRQINRQQQWIKSRTQSIRKPQFHPQVQSFQVYVNKIKFMSKPQETQVENKVAYFSPRKRKQPNGITQD